MRAACLLLLLLPDLDRPRPFGGIARATDLHAEDGPTAGRHLWDTRRILPNLGSPMRKLTVTQGASGATCHCGGTKLG